MRVRAVLGLAIALIAAFGAGAAVAVANDSDASERVVVESSRFELRGGGDASVLVPVVPEVEGFIAGEASVPLLEAFAMPSPPPGTPPIATAENPTHEGFTLVVSVVDESPDGEWLHVRLPQRPNGTTGWVKSDHITTWAVPNRVEVNLTVHRLTVFRADSAEVLFETDVATGHPRTPTPVGDFFIDIVNPLGGHRVYGWGQLSVSGFSDVLERFAGGIGQIALHGWNDYSVMGSASSNGCVRMRNEDIARVAELAPLGTPVRIVA